MTQERLKLDFPAWITYIFDHPVSDPQPEWYWYDDPYWWYATEYPNQTIEFLTRLFSNAPELLQPYDDAQINQGFWLIASKTASDYLLPLHDPTIPLYDRITCIMAMSKLYRGLFAKRCTPTLSHRNEKYTNPLNSICYMWWDMDGFWDLEEPQIHTAAIQVMEETLYMDNIACMESGLHGLNHWRSFNIPLIREVIDYFLSHHIPLRSEMIAYAEAAREGSLI